MSVDGLPVEKHAGVLIPQQALLESIPSKLSVAIS